MEVKLGYLNTLGTSGPMSVLMNPFDDSMKDESYKFWRGVTCVASSYFTPYIDESVKIVWAFAFVQLTS